MPMIQDIPNTQTFTAYQEFLEEYRMPDAQAYGHIRKGYRHSASGAQPGVLDSKSALDPAVGTHLGEDECFRQGLDYCQQGRWPLDSLAAEPDLKFAAMQMAKNHGRLREARKELQGAFKELSMRMQPVTKRLRTFQHATVASITKTLHLALIGTLVVIMF